jgi:hypothetical protein
MTIMILLLCLVSVMIIYNGLSPEIIKDMDKSAAELSRK